MERGQSVVVAGRYCLLRKLGEGGMGTVWLAHDLSLDARCALKLIEHGKRENPEIRLRFAREARAAAQVRSAHVARVFDHGEWEGVPFIAMEYLEGEDLGARIERCGRLDADGTCCVVAQVARALMRAHAAGIVHRDLKPENLFLAREDDGELCKVLDFGIAKLEAYSLQDRATQTGSFLGTPYYMSPEQARGETVDHRSDLWSLAVIAFHCLTGRTPFQSQVLAELLAQVMYGRLPLPSEIVADLPPALDAWWQRAADRDPEQRFQSARELSDALGAALGATPLTSLPSSLPPPPLPSTPPVVLERSLSSSGRNALFGLSGLVLGAAVTLVVGALRTRAAEPSLPQPALRAVSVPPPAATPLVSASVVMPAASAPRPAPATKKARTRPKKQLKPAPERQRRPGR